MNWFVQVKRGIYSHWFFRILLVLFVVQAVWFAASVRFGIPPDEVYHYNFINVYAQRSVWAGPIISHQASSTLSMGDLQRTPSYLYHYAMSFPLRVIDHLVAGVSARVFLLRLVNIGFAIITLFVLRQILRKLRVGEVVTNLVLLSFSLTGMFVWISAAINYDNLAILGFLTFVLSLLYLYEKVSLRRVLAVVMVSMATTLVKIDFAPVMFAAIVFYLFVNRKKLLVVFRQIGSDAKKQWSTNHRDIQLIMLVVVTLLVSVLFVERIGWNMIRYHSLTPSCASTHPVSECLASPIYRRSYNQSRTFEQFKAGGGHITPEPLGFTASWVASMYQRLFFYFGHKIILANYIAQLVFGAWVAYVLLLMGIKTKRLITNVSQASVLFVMFFYIALLFADNLDSYINSGAQFGYQGRYLLPILPFVFMFVIKLVSNALHSERGRKHLALWGVTGFLSIFFISQTFPFIVFIKGTDDSWYTPKTRTINLKMKRLEMKSHLFLPESLKNVEN